MKFLRTYDDWKHCITDVCNVPLTREFVAMRLKELRDTRDYNTQKFVGSWGEAHRMRVISWFEQAELELAEKSPNTDQP
ncbi:MAG: hypothetical protein AAGA50_05925 [Pseudomonadota bacterium]